MIIKNEALNHCLKKNNVKVTAEIEQAQMIGGKKVQDLIDEYKSKAVKAKEDSDKKTAELLAKSKKIAELQAAMKREETLLKKAVTESTSFKR